MNCRFLYSYINIFLVVSPRDMRSAGAAQAGASKTSKGKRPATLVEQISEEELESEDDTEKEEGDGEDEESSGSILD